MTSLRTLMANLPGKESMERQSIKELDSSSKMKKD